MQRYAEEAVTEHMTRLQAEYFVQNTTERNKTTPFVGISEKEIDNILERAMKTSDRWRFMKAQGKSEKEIRASLTSLLRWRYLLGKVKRYYNDSSRLNKIL